MRTGVVLVLSIGLAWWIHSQPVSVQPDLKDKIAIVTGGSRGLGAGIVNALLENGMVVYATSRSGECPVAHPRCRGRAVDHSKRDQVQGLFSEVEREHGELHLLVNNAYSAIGWWQERGVLGTSFWESPVELLDQVFEVGVKAHYYAAMLAVPLMQRAGEGMIVNTNSPGCVLYALNVAYGMGKCAIDKMTADMAMELGGAGGRIQVASWWAHAPIQSEHMQHGALDGNMTSRRGIPPGAAGVVPNFSSMYPTALSGTLEFEGRALTWFVRDQERAQFSGMAVSSSMAGARYGLVDNRGIRPPSVLSLKYHLSYLVPWLWKFSHILPGTKATLPQKIWFNLIPDFEIPQFGWKLFSGVPLSVQWPDLQPIADWLRPAAALTHSHTTL
eukprot:TRINITY_DN14900_c0_g1_i4.p1 TRINITY_DN14900_c0_g1~~TRINITY_DN14900_c0_g1_i4.p1  ORF type:complete len:387 (-),score=69.41 TRINITY_DN14900_c0_g1_i4:411-1571(-)